MDKTRIEKEVSQEVIKLAKEITGFKRASVGLLKTCSFIEENGLYRNYEIKNTSDNEWDTRRNRTFSNCVQIRKAGNGFYGMFIYY